MNANTWRQPWLAVVWLLAVGLLVSAVGCGDGGSESSPPSVVVIVVDTLRADHLGCYGYAKNTSPNLDAFAKQAMLFENCRSQAPETLGSVSTMLSGFLPHETLIYHPAQKYTLPRQVETLPELLEPAGYKSVAVISNYALRAGQGFDQGFELYDDDFESIEVVRRVPERIAEHTTDRAIELLTKHQDDRLFLYVHFQDPHGPYTPPEKYGRMMRAPDQPPQQLPVNRNTSGIGGIPSYQRLGTHTDYHHYVGEYDGEISYLDEHLGRLFEALKKLGYYDQALVIFTADHGEGMGEHDFYFAHGEYLYSASTHVPLIVRFGDAWRGRSQDVAMHLDITPTVLAAAEVELPSGLRGGDLRSPLGTGREAFATVRANPDGDRFSLSVDNWKLIYTPRHQRLELYDLSKDPSEARDLARGSGHDTIARDLFGRIVRTVQDDRLALDVNENVRDLTEEEREKLRALGYIR